MNTTTEARIRTARAISDATSIIAAIEHDLTGYEAIGWWDLHREQCRELAWWKGELKRLQAP